MIQGKIVSIFINGGRRRSNYLDLGVYWVLESYLNFVMRL